MIYENYIGHSRKWTSFSLSNSDSGKKGMTYKRLKTRLRILPKVELCDLYRSPGIVTLLKSRRLWKAGNVARMGRQRLYTECWWGNLLENLRIGDGLNWLSNEINSGLKL